MKIRKHKKVSEVADYLKLSKRTVFRLMRKNRWRAILAKRSPRDRVGVWYIYFPDVLKWLEKQSTG